MELTLYLDTHPDDLEALKQFNTNARKRMEIKRQFEEQFGPLQQFGNSYSPFPWAWNNEPWLARVVAHAILQFSYYLLVRKEIYRDLGEDYFDKQRELLVNDTKDGFTYNKLGIPKHFDRFQ